MIIPPKTCFFCDSSLIQDPNYNKIIDCPNELDHYSYGRIWFLDNENKMFFLKYQNLHLFIYEDSTEYSIREGSTRILDYPLTLNCTSLDDILNKFNNMLLLS